MMSLSAPFAHSAAWRGPRINPALWGRGREGAEVSMCDSQRVVSPLMTLGRGVSALPLLPRAPLSTQCDQDQDVWSDTPTRGLGIYLTGRGGRAVCWQHKDGGGRHSFHAEWKVGETRRASLGVELESKSELLKYSLAC